MATRERPGRLPGRQTEQPNAGPEFDAERDLRMQGKVPGDVRARLQQGDLGEDARGLRETGDLSGPEGAHQESRGRGTRQERE